MRKSGFSVLRSFAAKKCATSTLESSSLSEAKNEINFTEGEEHLTGGVNIATGGAMELAGLQFPHRFICLKMPCGVVRIGISRRLPT